MSQLGYDPITGLLTSQASPMNVNPEAAPGDVAASTTVLAAVTGTADDHQLLQ